MKCKVVHHIETGNYTVLKVPETSVDKGLYANSYNVDKVNLVLHVSDDNFDTLNPEFVNPRFDRWG